MSDIFETNPNFFYPYFSAPHTGCLDLRAGSSPADTIWDFTPLTVLRSLFFPTPRMLQECYNFQEARGGNRFERLLVEFGRMAQMR